MIEVKIGRTKVSVFPEPVEAEQELNLMPSEN